MTSLIATARSDEPVTPKIIPLCTVYSVPNVGQVCGYTLDEFKLVLKMDNELFYLRGMYDQEHLKSSNLALAVTDLQRQAAALKSSLDIVTTRNEELTAQLLQLDQKYQQERIKPRWGSPLAWSVAALSVAVLAGVLIGDAY